MSDLIRRILDMLVKVLSFVHAHPFDDPAQTIAVTALEGRAARLQALVEQEHSGRLAESGAKVIKDTLQDKILDGLTLLSRLAATALRQDPSMPVRLSLPRPHAGQQDLLAGGRAVVKEAKAQQEVLFKYGLPPQFLDELADTLDQFEAAMGAKVTGASSHVGANTEIQSLASEVRQLVKLLDAFYRPRFRDNPELKGAWKAAKAVARHTPKSAADPDTPATPTAPADSTKTGSDAGHPAA